MASVAGAFTGWLLGLTLMVAASRTSPSSSMHAGHTPSAVRSAPHLPQRSSVGGEDIVLIALLLSYSKPNERLLTSQHGRQIPQLFIHFLRRGDGLGDFGPKQFAITLPHPVRCYLHRSFRHPQLGPNLLVRGLSRLAPN